MMCESETKEPGDSLTGRVIGAAIEVHRELGPGLMESAYEECLCYELSQLGVPFVRQIALPVIYKSMKFDCAYRLDVMVDSQLIVEIKTVDKLAPVHEAQLLTYLKMTGCPVGLLLNFNVPVMRHGIRRMALTR